MMAIGMIEKWALNAFADGQLNADDARAVEALLQTDEAARNTLADVQAQKAALHKAFDPVLDEALPPALLRAVQNNQAGRWPAWALAAGLAALCVGGLGGWQAKTLWGGNVQMAETLPQRALDAFSVYGVEVNHAVEVAGTDADKAHLQTWLSKRVGVKFTVPDLSAQGYMLIGGRLLPEAGKPAGLLMYEDANKKRLAIYVAANDARATAPMTMEHRGTLVTCYWVEPDLVYALAGEQPSAQMLALAQAAHEGFDKDG